MELSQHWQFVGELGHHRLQVSKGRSGLQGLRFGCYLKDRSMTLVSVALGRLFFCVEFSIMIIGLVVLI